MAKKPSKSPATDARWAPPSENEFEFAKSVFEQNFAQFRHLNDHMNRLPAFAVTLTGGFWYVAVVIANYGEGLDPLMERLARWALLIFAGLCDFMIVAIAIRIRHVMTDYLDRVQRYEGEWWSERAPERPNLKNYSMISMYSVLIAGGGILSWGAAFVLFWPNNVLGWPIGLFITILLSILLAIASFLVSKWLTPKLK